MTFRFWAGAWCTLFLLIMVAFDLSALVRYITRFTEECFSVLISLIFIYEAINKLLGLDKTHPIEINPKPDYDCHCILPDCSTLKEWQIVNGTGCLNSTTSIEHINSTSLISDNCINFKKQILVATGCIYESDCLSFAGNLTGPACFDKKTTHAIPDVFLMSIILFVIVFSVAYTLQAFRHSRFMTQFVSAFVYLNSNPPFFLCLNTSFVFTNYQPIQRNTSYNMAVHIMHIYCIMQHGYYVSNTIY